MEKIRKSFEQIGESIARDIREGIISGKLHPGERLKVLDIAAKYGVSNTPVREAFRHLASEGFVQNIPRKMVVVKEITLKEVEDIYAIQAVLEGLAAGLAAEKLMSPLHYKKLKNLHGLMEKYLKEGKMDKFIKANQKFHHCIINASGNEKLVKLIGNLRDQIQRFRSIVLHHAGRGEESCKEHERILDALAALDAEKSEEEVKHHIRNAADILKKIIEQRGTIWGRNSDNSVDREGEGG